MLIKLKNNSSIIIEKSDDNYHQVWFKIGCQSFPVGTAMLLPDAKWYAKQLDIALGKFIKKIANSN